MAFKTEYLYAGVPHNIVVDASLENPISYNDTFTVGETLYFGLRLVFLNGLRTSMGQGVIAAPFIGNYTVTVFLCDSIDGGLNFVNVRNVKQYLLGPLVNSFIYENITTILENYSNNDQLFESMSAAEIQSLKKSFKLIFRINLTSSPNVTQSIQNGDLVQNLFLVADTMQPGPYEVNFEHIDLLSPNDFTDQERQDAYSLNVNLIMGEAARCFYPKNINALAPIPFVFCVRANAGNVENYDTYLSLFASYGYFCMSFFQDVTTTGQFIFDNGIYQMTDTYQFSRNQQLSFSGGLESGSYQHGIITIGYLTHIEENLDKIAGGKFNNKIDFSKLIPMGHSRGGGAIFDTYELLLYKNNANNLISKFNTPRSHTDIKCMIALAPSKSDVLGASGSIFEIATPICAPEALPSVVPPYDGNFLGLTSYRYYEYAQGISQPQYSLLNSSNVSNLRLNVNVPLLFLYPEYDADTDINTLTLFKATNIDANGNIVNDKKIIFIKKLDHNGVSNNIFSWWPINGLKSIRLYGQPSQSGLIFNNLSSRTLYLASKSLEFIAKNVFGSYLNTDVLNNRRDFSARKQALMNCFEYTEQPKTSSIVRLIDGFTGGITFATNIVGYTFADGIDKSVKDHLAFISEPGFTMAPDLYAKGLIFLNNLIENSASRKGNTYPEDIFDQLYTSYDNGLLVSFDNTLSEYFVGYTFSPAIDLTGASFLYVNAAQISSAPLNAQTETETPTILGIRLIDSSLRAATLLCLNYNDGIADPSSYFIAGGTAYTYSQINKISFRLQDFLNRESTMALNQITNLEVLFGSNYGTTQGTIFLDSIYAI